MIMQYDNTSLTLNTHLEALHMTSVEIVKNASVISKNSEDMKARHTIDAESGSFFGNQEKASSSLLATYDHNIPNSVIIPTSQGEKPAELKSNKDENFEVVQPHDITLSYNGLHVLPENLVQREDSLNDNREHHKNGQNEELADYHEIVGHYYESKENTKNDKYKEKVQRPDFKKQESHIVHESRHFNKHHEHKTSLHHIDDPILLKGPQTIEHQRDIETHIIRIKGNNRNRHLLHPGILNIDYFQESPKNDELAHEKAGIQEVISNTGITRNPDTFTARLVSKMKDASLVSVEKQGKENLWKMVPGSQVISKKLEDLDRIRIATDIGKSNSSSLIDGRDDDIRIPESIKKIRNTSSLSSNRTFANLRYEAQNYLATNKQGTWDIKKEMSDDIKKNNSFLSSIESQEKAIKQLERSNSGVKGNKEASLDNALGKSKETDGRDKEKYVLQLVDKLSKKRIGSDDKMLQQQKQHKFENWNDKTLFQNSTIDTNRRYPTTDQEKISINTNGNPQYTGSQLHHHSNGKIMVSGNSKSDSTPKDNHYEPNQRQLSDENPNAEQKLDSNAKWSSDEEKNKITPNSNENKNSSEAKESDKDIFVIQKRPKQITKKLNLTLLSGNSEHSSKRYSHENETAYLDNASTFSASQYNQKASMVIPNTAEINGGYKDIEFEKPKGGNKHIESSISGDMYKVPFKSVEKLASHEYNPESTYSNYSSETGSLSEDQKEIASRCRKYIYIIFFMPKLYFDLHVTNSLRLSISLIIKDYYMKLIAIIFIIQLLNLVIYILKHSLAFYCFSHAVKKTNI